MIIQSQGHHILYRSNQHFMINRLGSTTWQFGGKLWFVKYYFVGILFLKITTYWNKTVMISDNMNDVYSDASHIDNWITSVKGEELAQLPKGLKEIKYDSNLLPVC